MDTEKDVTIPKSDSLVCIFCKAEVFNYDNGPLMLPCLHSSCKSCLEKLTKNSKGETKSCTACGDQFMVSGDISSYPVNLRLLRLAQKKKNNKAGSKCHACEDDATFFCCDNGECYCDTCKKDFQRLSSKSRFTELGADDGGSIIGNGSAQNPPICLWHRNEKLTMYCIDCKALICNVCVQTNHAGKEHTVDSTENAMKDEWEGFLKLPSSLNSNLSALDEKLQKIQEIKENVKQNSEIVAGTINKTCNDLIQAVETRRKVLLQKCQDIAREKCDVLSNQGDKLQKLKQKMQLAKDHAMAVDHQTKEETLSTKDNIERRFKYVKTEHERSSIELREDDTICISLDASNLLEEIKNIGCFPGVPDASKCVAIGDLETSAVMFKEKKVEVLLKDEMGVPLQGQSTVLFQYNLEKKQNDPTYILPKVTVDRSCGDISVLRFTPDKPGEYELTMLVGNKPLRNPYVIDSVSFSDCYKKFEEMQPAEKKVSGKCYGVAVGEDGTIYATDYKANTVKVFKPGQPEREIGSDHEAERGKLSKPMGLAVDGDTLYIASYGDHTVKKYSISRRKFTREIGGKGKENGSFMHPYTVTIDKRGKLYVADHGQKRIQIFTALNDKYEFMASISCDGSPNGVAVDLEGKVYTAMEHKSYVSVHSPHVAHKGEYNLQPQLNPLRKVDEHSFHSVLGICIDNQGNKVIVTENLLKTHNTIFIVDGNDSLVASRRIDGAYGVTISKAGEIIVAETYKKQVSVFPRDFTIVKKKNSFMYVVVQ